MIKLTDTEVVLAVHRALSALTLQPMPEGYVLMGPEGDGQTLPERKAQRMLRRYRISHALSTIGYWPDRRKHLAQDKIQRRVTHDGMTLTEAFLDYYKDFIE